ncbi:hypothetical protein JTE90_010445 [Oedothorax gibbosus]|uniref:Uncharacterized protein n=1 Tax=Oedothorax gibbosus TaxID=931172 RepID=A0AAV6W3Z4_9ARAC|nr:hypothetical protein JTE90_010445 [Oedothorax gibbosus]
MSLIRVSRVFRIFHHHLSARGKALLCLLEPASLSLKLRTNLRFMIADTASDIHEDLLDEELAIFSKRPTLRRFPKVRNFHQLSRALSTFYNLQISQTFHSSPDFPTLKCR